MAAVTSRSIRWHSNKVYWWSHWKCLPFIHSIVLNDLFVCFRLDLDLGKLATGFGLLKLPVMPELKDKTVEFEPVDVDVEKICYKDKNREKQRKRKLQEQQDSKQGTTPQANTKRKKLGRDSVPWSKNKERKVKREKRKARREFLKKQRQKQRLDEDELEDLAREARLVKKLKSGKISKEEFECQVGIEDEDT